MSAKVKYLLGVLLFVIAVALLSSGMRDFIARLWAGSSENTVPFDPSTIGINEDYNEYLDSKEAFSHKYHAIDLKIECQYCHQAKSRADSIRDFTKLDFSCIQCHAKTNRFHEYIEDSTSSSGNAVLPFPGHENFSLDECSKCHY